MEEINAVRALILEQIEDIDGGFATVARKMNITSRALQKTLSKEQTRKPRLKTLRAIKVAVNECRDEQSAIIATLLA